MLHGGLMRDRVTSAQRKPGEKLGSEKSRTMWPNGRGGRETRESDDPVLIADDKRNPLFTVPK